MKIFFGTTCILVFFNINHFTGTCDLIKKNLSKELIKIYKCVYIFIWIYVFLDSQIIILILSGTAF